MLLRMGGHVNVAFVAKQLDGGQDVIGNRRLDSNLCNKLCIKHAQMPAIQPRKCTYKLFPCRVQDDSSAFRG
jgi:hypothetical protein